MMIKDQNKRRSRPPIKPRDYSHDPFIVIWEVTRACALQCLHCRAEAQYHPDPRQLDLEQGKILIRQIAEFDQPLLVFTGGDPLMRPDLYELIRYAVEEHGLSVSMTPSATPRVTRRAVEMAGEAGLSRWAFSLDGSCDKIHDHFRGTPGSYERTMQGIHYLQELNIPIQVNTTVSRYNLEDLPHIAERVREMGAVLWSVFFLIPTGRAQMKDMITPKEHEEVMEWLFTIQQQMPYGVKATEAPHYRRVVIQQSLNTAKESFNELKGNKRYHQEDSKPKEAKHDSVLKRADVLGRAPQGVNDGDGFVFISHTGEVYPSGFLPLSCGNIKDTPLTELYRYSPIMRELRDKSLLKGKCGQCEFNRLCGGSRARAYAVTGDYLQSDPACAYMPAGWTGVDQ